MSRSNELFMQQHDKEVMVDDTDQQYFEWLREQDWNKYVAKTEYEFRKKYSYGATFRLMWADFLNKNGML